MIPEEIDPAATFALVDCDQWVTDAPGQGGVSDAASALTRALRLRPDWAEGHNSLAVALRLQHRLDEAIFHCREAIRLAPDLAEAHNNLGSMLEEQGRLQEATASLSRALRLKPDLANAWSNLGITLYREQRYAEAAAYYREAIALDPHLAEAHNNLACVLVHLGQTEQALASFAEAIRLKPDYREPHWGRALVWLSRGEFELGWPELEWRPSLAEMAQQQRPRWDGSDPAGRTILLVAEQGLGDTLQFVRYGSLLKRQGARVLLACQPELVTLLAAGCPVVDELVPQGGDLPPHDAHIPLLSLPAAFGATLDDVLAAVPYLHPHPPLVEKWRKQVSQYPGLKIGIAWQGNPNNRGDRERSIPLTAFAPLARAPNVRLFSLQKGAGVEQVQAVKQDLPLIEFDASFDEAAGAFMDTAALMHCLDLVVTCDSAVCHLAGAMGVPAWAAIPESPDWRWLLDRDDSPWYPTVRLFRQTVPGDWSQVFERIASAAAQMEFAKNP